MKPVFIRSYYNAFLTFWTYFGTILDLFLDQFWTSFGPVLDQFWTSLDQFWTSLGQFGPFWDLRFNFGPVLDHFGPVLDQFWTSLDQFWTSFGPVWTVLGFEI